MTQVLAGIRVLDFGRYIAGPYCAALLGHLGAEVIRVERPFGSEDRFLAPISESGEGGLFMQVNANKLGLTLDIASDEGRGIVKALVATADVVVANLPPDTLAGLGLDYETLQGLNPRVILVTNTVYGHDTPFANKIGFDGLAQAMSGAVHFSGMPGQPVRTAVQYVDFSTALAATIGVLAALMARQQTGRGQVVQTSLLATALTLANGSLIEQSVAETNRVPSGNRAQIVGPADIFATQDGHLIIQVVGPYIFKRWARLMGEEMWLTDPRFADDTQRGQHNELLSERTARWCAERTTAQALAELEGARIPAGPVLSFQQALAHPYVQALGHLQPVDYPATPRPAPVAKAPFGLSETAVALRHRAPTPGEHTDVLLQQLGYTPAGIAALRDKGVV